MAVAGTPEMTPSIAAETVSEDVLSPPMLGHGY